MTDEWYYANEERERIPISEKDLNQLASDKLITEQTLVWNPSLPDWQPCGSVCPEWFSNNYGSAAPPKLPDHIKPVSGKPAHPLAMASLVCGLVSLIPLGCLGVFGIIFLPIAFSAIICGHLALKKIRHPDCETNGRGVAIAGLVTGYLSLAAMTLLTLIFGSVMLLPMLMPPNFDDDTSSPSETSKISPSSLPENQE